MTYQKIFRQPFYGHFQGSSTRQKCSGGLRSKARRRGQALIEMALVVIVLLFLTLGLIQYGLLANAKITMANLAREGARYAAVNGTDQSAYGFSTDPGENIRKRVLFIASSTILSDMDDNNIKIEPEYNSEDKPQRGELIHVTIKYPLGRKLILPSSFPGLDRFSGDTETKVTMVLE